MTIFHFVLPNTFFVNSSIDFSTDLANTFIDAIVLENPKSFEDFITEKFTEIQQNEAPKVDKIDSYFLDLLRTAFMSSVTFYQSRAPGHVSVRTVVANVV